MQFSASEICNFLNGSLQGDPDIKIARISKIEEAKEGSISFIANPKYESYLYSTEASAIIVSKSLEVKEGLTATLIRVEDPYTSFSKLLTKFDTSEKLKGISSQAFISGTAKIGDNVYIAPFVYIGDNVTIGDNTQIYPNCFLGDSASVGANTILNSGVNIYHDCKVGADCIIHSGAVIGSDGFGFAPQQDGTYEKVAQTGNVIIEDNVEIGANTTIDRATLGSTTIRSGVKLDNLVQIAHNVEIDQNTVVASQSGISGSTKLGKNCAIGGQVGFAGHLSIAPGTKIGAQSGIPADIKEPNKVWHGTPIQELKNELKSMVIYKKLPEMLKRIEELEKALQLAEKEQ